METTRNWKRKEKEKLTWELLLDVVLESPELLLNVVLESPITKRWFPVCLSWQSANTLAFSKLKSKWETPLSLGSFRHCKGISLQDSETSSLYRWKLPFIYAVDTSMNNRESSSWHNFTACKKSQMKMSRAYDNLINECTAFTSRMKHATDGSNSISTKRLKLSAAPNCCLRLGAIVTWTPSSLVGCGTPT